MKIPPSDLSDEALAGVIDSFVLKEGTDYGPVSYSHLTLPTIYSV